MLLMNLGVVTMLWYGLRAERTSRAGTALAVLPFAVPSVVVSSRLVEHAGGNIEPFVFLLLAFLLRARPIALCLVLGVAVMNREFVLIGFVALLIMDGIEGYWTSFEVDWLTRERVILSPPPHNDPRVDRYRKAVDAHRNEAAVISTQPCPNGERELRWYICPPRWAL